MPLIATYIRKLVTNPKRALCCILGFTCLLYLPSLGNQLQTGWDDQWQVNNWYTEGGLTWTNIQAIFTEPLRFQYSPIDQLMYTLIYQFSGYTPMVFHAASLLLHLLNITLVYYLMRRILKDVSRHSDATIARVCFPVCAVFALHPMQVESVAWVSASKIPLYSLFFLLGLLAWTAYLRRPKWRTLIPVFAAFILSYGSKEQAVIFPVMTLLLSLIYGKRLTAFPTWGPLLQLFLLALVLGVISVVVISSFSQIPFGGTYDYVWWQRVVFSIYALVEYVMKWFAPFNLMHLYHFPMPPSEPMPGWLLAYPLLFAVGCVAVVSRMKHPVVRIGVLVFLINIVLVLHLFPIRRPNIVADRYIYLSGIGLTLPVVYLLVTHFREWRKQTQRGVALGFGMYLILLATYSHQRAGRWEDTATLKQELIDARNKAGKEEMQ